METIFNEILELVSSYTEWFKNETTVKRLKGGIVNVIHTPFLDFNNDRISVYATLKDNEIVLSDDRSTFNNLEMVGLGLTEKRQEHLNHILNRTLIKLSENQEIIKTTDEENFAHDLHSLITAIIDIGNLQMTSQDKVATFFHEDVLNYLDKKKIYYTENVRFTGKSNFIHNYDLLFQRNDKNPTRLCNIVDNPNKGKIADILFSWEDTKDARKKDSLESALIVILNDEKKISDNVIDALKRYDVKPIPWSQKEKNISFLQ